MIVIGIDPGRKKTGICVVDSIHGILRRSVISSITLSDYIIKYKLHYPDATIVCGDSTSSKDLVKSLDTNSNDVIFIDEKNSTVEARKLYWKKHRKPWWALLIPKSLLHPPRRVDDYAAVVIVYRYLKSIEKNN